MVLILSSISDQSTLEVIKWLNFFRVKWIKLDGSSKLEPVGFSIDQKSEDFILKQDNGALIRLCEITAYWYRRNDFNLSKLLMPNEIENDPLKRSLYTHVKREVDYLKTGIHHFLSGKINLSDFRYSDLNKMEVLSHARRVGLLIPETLIATHKDHVIPFIQQHKKVISKAIQHGARFALQQDERQLEYLCYTEEFKAGDIPTHFFPTLFQNKLDKAYEIRTFFVEDQYYSMAIFSQNDSSTATDFRQYNLANPNRTVPIHLPEKITCKLKQLMRNLNLNSGSIDLVVTKSEEFVFLEVNPIGQFGMVSTPCNYYLHKTIAQYLTQNYDQN